MALWSFCALAIGLIASALFFVLRTARRLRVRHRAVFAAALPAFDLDGERLIDAPRALYHGTRFADGTALLAPAWREACVGDLWCTQHAIFLQGEWDPRGEAAPVHGGQGGKRLVFPLAWVSDASLVRAFAPLVVKELPMLRLRWRRGGELLETDFSLAGGTPALEALRREIHLRQGQGSALVSLGLLLTKEPVPGGGHK